MNYNTNSWIILIVFFPRSKLVPYEKVLGQIGIAFKHLQSLSILIGRMENSQQSSSCLRSVGNRVSKNKKNTHDNSSINYS